MIKPMQWESPDQFNNYVYLCKTIIGVYHIHIDGGRHSAWIETSEKIWDGPTRGSLEEAQEDAYRHFRSVLAEAVDTDAIIESAARICDGILVHNDGYVHFPCYHANRSACISKESWVIDLTKAMARAIRQMKDPQP